MGFFHANAPKPYFSQCVAGGPTTPPPPVSTPPPPVSTPPPPVTTPAPPATTRTPASDKAALLAAKVFPDVIASFDPTVVFKVTYSDNTGKKTVVDPGTMFTVAGTRRF